MHMILLEKEAPIACDTCPARACLLGDARQRWLDELLREALQRRSTRKSKIHHLALGPTGSSLPTICISGLEGPKITLKYHTSP